MAFKKAYEICVQHVNYLDKSKMLALCKHSVSFVLSGPSGHSHQSVARWEPMIPHLELLVLKHQMHKAKFCDLVLYSLINTNLIKQVQLSKIGLECNLR